ncbi:hypothetical protein BP00DRAFT_462285 [Aspergillus indologenus CBS 114.80]|uniref:CCHC-type domain-containing protein n=1 Tax=Aspergillus indologenus CBS 114.80 TaxID=1450541 RepID=A0A2V5HKD5_9EURO|nr:hypothetical protein BP00DRAFT_462285 [Aspergillus indologenus CBS 114.80]
MGKNKWTESGLPKCNNCHRVGHFANDCPDIQMLEGLLAMGKAKMAEDKKEAKARARFKRKVGEKQKKEERKERKKKERKARKEMTGVIGEKESNKENKKMKAADIEEANKEKTLDGDAVDEASMALEKALVISK